MEQIGEASGMKIGRKEEKYKVAKNMWGS